MLNKTQWINTYNNFITSNKAYNETTNIESLIESCEWMNSLLEIKFNGDIGTYIDTMYDKIVVPLTYIIEKMHSINYKNYLDLLIKDHHPMFDDLFVKECFYEMLENGKTSIDYEYFATEEDELKGVLSEQTIKISSLEEFYDYFIYFDEDMFKL